MTICSLHCPNPSPITLTPQGMGKDTSKGLAQRPGPRTSIKNALQGPFDGPVH